MTTTEIDPKHLDKAVRGQDYQPGTPFPQGATWDGKGVNFALFSEASESVDLCFFDRADQTKEKQRIQLLERTKGVWHIYIPGMHPGQLYGYRVHGPYEPQKGLRFNPNKLLLDPYAKGIGRELKWADELFGYQIGNKDADLSFDERDSAPFAPLGMVVDGTFDWSDEKRPNIPWHEMVIYEAHVRGMTQLHPEVPEKLRGTYAGIASDPMLRHFQKLGITAVELMPVHHYLHDRLLIEKGLRNYWGYNTLNFFSPEPSYATNRFDPVKVIKEFKEMVKRFHNAGMEVILDVVYNHTAEGNQAGPTLSFRGIDNLAYYRTENDNPRYYRDFTGCGNTLNMVHPHSLQLLMDSLRYWVTEMHIDGFRFDLAAALARELNDVDQLGAFFDTIYQDPVLATVKLIAEPWDLGAGGYQVGNFPIGWTEWNGKFRDASRKFLKGDLGLHAEIATRLGGSADLYESTRRLPSSSINLITAHDGFTLNDLVSYDHKHNEKNLDENRDGTDDNASWNCGAEGETTDENILQLRERQKRNFLCMLMFSQGVPMICGGDEISRTQQGNNNGYCQDNELSWHHWDLDQPKKALLDFASKIVHYRRAHPNFHRRSFHESDPSVSSQNENVQWIRADGKNMEPVDWEKGGWMRTLGMLLKGDAPEIRDREGCHITDDDFMLVINSHFEPVEFKLPQDIAAWDWKVAVDTSRPELPIEEEPVQNATFKIEARSFMVLVHPRHG
jgi:glycogen operon protein